MRRNGRKRSHAQYVQDLVPDTPRPNDVGIASTLAHLRNSDLLPLATKDDEESSREWKVVERRSKNSKKVKGVSADSRREIRRDGSKSDKKKDNRPALNFAELHKIQSSLKIADLQALVLYCLADGTSPQWISVRHHTQVKKAVALLVPGLEKDMFNGHIDLAEATSDISESSSAQPNSKLQDVENFGEVLSKSKNDIYSYHASTRSPDYYVPMALSDTKLSAPLKPLASVFEHMWPVKAPGDDKYFKLHSPLHAMLNAPIPKSHEEKRAEKNIKGPKPAGEGKFWENKPTSITAFIASIEELQDNEYTLHPCCFSASAELDRDMARRKAAKETIEHGWADTRVQNLEEANIPETEIGQGSVTAGRTILAMDCEMCLVEGGEMVLTRISVVAWDGSVIMDELVKPDKPIIDYLTPYSGITAKKLENITTSLLDIQARLLDIINTQTILLGHSLNSDLTALKLTHPFIVDTSIIYQHPRGPPLKSSLKWLVQKYLNREIQKDHGTLGHDSIEDARACLDLVRMKCEKGARWGTNDAAGESIFKRLARSSRSQVSIYSDGKVGAIVDHGTPERNFGTMARVCIGCKSDQEVVEGVRRAVLGDVDGAIVPGGGVDFTWARLRELEAFRGWSNDNRHANNPPIHPERSSTDPTVAALSVAVSRTVQHVLSIHALLPPCTLLIVYSGTGDPREISRLQEMQRQFKREYATKKWDELSVRWTDAEEQSLRTACQKARSGLGFLVVT